MLEGRVRGMPYVMGTFDQKGVPQFWGIYQDMDAATGTKFWPPLIPELRLPDGTVLYCGWTKEELREFWLHLRAN